MATSSGEKDDCQLPAAEALLEEAAGMVPNAVLSGDALHCQKRRL